MPAPCTRARPLRWAIALCAVLTTTGFRFAPPPPTQPPTPVPRASTCEVGIVGDSITVAMETLGSLSRRLETIGCTVTAIDARVSRPTSEGAAVVERWAATGRLPRILVIALGTNDCDTTRFARAANRIMAASQDRRIVWVNTYRRTCDQRINPVIALLGSSGRVTIVDHHRRATDNPWMLRRDGVHLSSTGVVVHTTRLIESILGRRLLIPWMGGRGRPRLERTGTPTSAAGNEGGSGGTRFRPSPVRGGAHQG